MSMAMDHITLNQGMSTNEVIIRLNNLRRWTEITSQGKYNELAKQALNCVIVYLLAKFAEHEGKSIRYEDFPRIALGRAYAKVYVYFDTPEHKIDEICRTRGINKREFDRIANKIIIEKTDYDFASFLSEGIGEYEVRLYRAATKIATYVELLEHQTQGISKKLQDIERNLDAFEDIPGVSEFSNTESEYFKIFQTISRLRNQTRWAVFSYNIECSVLGHLFDTAIFAYFMALNQTNFDEKYASRMFFMGIYHDIAEVWTKDIPSTIKDAIPGFRYATEQYEMEQIEKHVYSKIPDFLSKELKKVMLEEAENMPFHDLVKQADYLSADSECYRNLVAGSRDKGFADVIIERDKKDMTPFNLEMHKFFEKYAKVIDL